MTKKIKNPTSEWFIRPLDGHTNEVIARELARGNNVDELETELGGMFRCPYSKINFFLQSTEMFKLRFEIYRKRRVNSKLERWEFGHKKRTKRSKKYQEIKKQIEK